MHVLVCFMHGRSIGAEWLFWGYFNWGRITCSAGMYIGFWKCFCVYRGLVVGLVENDPGAGTIRVGGSGRPGIGHYIAIIIINTLEKDITP